jgi:hypothetical protein
MRPSVRHPAEGQEEEIVNGSQGPFHYIVVGREQLGRDDIEVMFDEAQRFVEAHWTEFDDPAGVAADLAELKLAVSDVRPTNPLRTRLTLHRLNRIGGKVAPVAAVVCVVREMLGAAE